MTYRCFGGHWRMALVDDVGPALQCKSPTASPTTCLVSYFSQMSNGYVQNGARLRNYGSGGGVGDFELQGCPPFGYTGSVVSRCCSSQRPCANTEYECKVMNYTMRYGSTIRNDVYYNVENIGSHGGYCTCPDEWAAIMASHA